MSSTNSLSIVTILLAMCMTAACSTNETDLKLDNISSKQQSVFTNLPSLNKVVLDDSLNARFIAGNLGKDSKGLLAGFAITGESSTVTDSKLDALGFKIDKYEQSHNGMNVVGGDIRMVTNASEDIVALSGKALFVEDLNEDITFPLNYAVDLAKDEIAGTVEATESDLVLIAPSSGASIKQAWKITLKGKNEFLPIHTDVFVDTETGRIVDKHPHVHSAKERETYDSSAVDITQDLTIQQVKDISTLARTEGQGPSANTEVNGAHDAVGATYDCLKEEFGRDSYDDQGGKLTSFADLGGPEFANAFWLTDGGIMGFGTGFAVSDVGTHEVFHGVTDKSAGLIYQNEPGALAEAFSDIFTATCKSRTTGVTPASWLIAPDLRSDILPAGIGALRKMDDPTLDGISRDHYEDRFLGEGDNGGVHLNSGIPNLAYVLLVQGGTHPRQMNNISVDGIGLDASGQIFYRALTTYIDSGSNFENTRAATEQAAEDLFGADSKESHSVQSAWAAVGVGLEPAPFVEVAPQEKSGENASISSSSDVASGGCNSTKGQSSLAFSLFLTLLFFGRNRKFGINE